MGFIEHAIVLILDDLIHGIEGVKRIGLLLSMDGNGVRKFWKIPSFGEDVVSYKYFFGLIDVSEYKKAIIVNRVEFLYVFNESLVRFGRRERA
jgi:hypothetical protein